MAMGRANGSIISVAARLNVISASTKKKPVFLFLSFFSTVHRRPFSALALPWLSTSSSQNAVLQSPPNQTKFTSQQQMTRAQVISLLKEQQQRGDFRAALDIFNAASRQKSFRHNQATYAVMIHVLGHAHKFKAMELLLNRMKQEPFKFGPGVFADVIRVYGRADMPEKAITTFYSALQSFRCPGFLKFVGRR